MNDIGHSPPTAATGDVDCDTAIRRLWLYLDDALDGSDGVDPAAVRHHLEACRTCHPHTEFERALLVKIAAARREHDDPAGLRLAVERALREAGVMRGA